MVSIFSLPLHNLCKKKTAWWNLGMTCLRLALKNKATMTTCKDMNERRRNKKKIEETRQKENKENKKKTKQKI